MFELKNLHKESKEGWIYLVCDINVTDIESPFDEKKLWIAVEEKNEHMLSDELYDPFVLVPLVLGMYYAQDVKIDGYISPRLLYNIKHYLSKIFDNFSDNTSPVSFSVSGTKVMSTPMGNLVGTGISCGVDSLSTIYDNYICENDSEFKINSLFFVNCGTHGDYEDDRSRALWLDRSRLNIRCAEELGLPMILIDSNFHAFTHKIGEQKIGYLAIYSCILSLQKEIKRYYTSSNLSYDEIADFRKESRDFDIAEYSESYMPHLISTERFELVIDGCQYTRGEKTERISEWPVARKYLNVCLSHDAELQGGNCSVCHKCMWTLIPLEAMGKLNNFNSVFNIDEYQTHAEYYKNKFLLDYGKDAMETSIINYCRKKGMQFPSRKEVLKYFNNSKPKALQCIKKQIRKIIGTKKYETLKSIIKKG